MSGTNDGFACHIAFRNHHLLGQEHLTGWDLNSKITTSNHDAVGLLEDFIKVGDTLFILNLDDDLDVGAIGTKGLSDIQHILGSTDKGGEDHINAILYAELKVLLVFLGQSREVDGSLGEVNAFAGGERAVVHRLDVDFGALDSGHLKRENAVVDVDDLADFGDFGEIRLG